jgi:hypothetical protein
VVAEEDTPLRMKTGDDGGIRNETPPLLVEGTVHLLHTLGCRFWNVIEIVGLGHQEDRGRGPEVVLVHPLDGVVATSLLIFRHLLQYILTYR